MGIIFDIKRFAVHDGPGIRTTIHLKGCPLSCDWCHNPEGINPDIVTVKKEIQLDGKHFTKNEIIGKQHTAYELFNEVMKDRLFWEESNGGVTFSGGEPFMQFDFLLASLKLFKENNIHTVVDTSAFVEQEKLAQAAPYVDLFLVDLKFIDRKRHKEYTGVSNQIILENIKWLIDTGKEIQIRIPVVPTKNFNQHSLDDFIHFLNKSKIEEVDLLPFHSIATAKYERFGMKNKMEEIPTLKGEELDYWKEAFERNHIKVQIGG